MTSLTVPFGQNTAVAFEQLFQRSRRRAYTLAYRLMGNAADAEDVTQDAYVRAWNHFQNYDATRSFESWLYCIVTNRALDVLKRQRRVVMYSLDAALTSDNNTPLVPETVSANSDPASILLDSILDEPLQKALAALPEEYRTSLLLLEQDMSYEEIAARVGCPVGTVRSRVFRARRQLQAALSAK